MIRPVRTLARLSAVATCALAAFAMHAQVGSGAQAGPEATPELVDFAISAHFYELSGGDQDAAASLGYEREDVVWRQLRFEPGDTLIAVKIGEIIPASAIGSGPRVAISGFAQRAARLSDAWGVMLTSSPEAAFDELPEDLQLQARALGYSAGDQVVFTAMGDGEPRLALFDPCTGPELKVRLPEPRKRFEMHLGRMAGFQQFTGCALFDELHRKIQAEVSRHGYSEGDRVKFLYDSSQESTSVVPR